MAKFIDLTGKRFGRLVVLSRATNVRTRPTWVCACDCGGERKVTYCNLASGNTQSCGCFHRERVREVKTTHGHSSDGNHSREYRSWEAAKRRCFNPNDRSYGRYGGRGITMCDAWKNSFESFLKDMGKCPHGMTIDRIDNRRGYEPSNCRWTTAKVQSRNRRSNIVVEFDGERMTVAELAERKGLKYGTLYSRLYRDGQTVDQAVSTTPAGGF